MKNKINLWWTHTWFSIKYPVRFTDPVTWLEAYNVYLKDLKQLRN